MFGSWRGRLPRMGRWPRLALAGVCLLLAAHSALSARTSMQAARSSRSVVVAARDLAAGRVLTTSDVTIVHWPRSLTPERAAASRAEVIGRQLSGPISTREPITGARLLGHDATTGLSMGMVAVPVVVADPHIGELVHAGDRVDLLAAGGPDDTSAAGDTVASAVRVLSVIRPRDSDGPALAGADGGGTELVIVADSVTARRIVRLATTQTLAAVGIPP